jgi:hypothetical protein
MTVLPSWSPGDPGAAAPFRSLLAALPPDDRRDPGQVALEFSLPGVHLTAEPAAAGLDDVVAAAGKRLKRRGFACGPVYPAPVAGFPDGQGRVVTQKKRGRRPAGPPQFQLYAMAGPYSLVMTASEADAGLIHGVGPIRLDPPVPPAVTPVVRIPAADQSGVEEKLVISRRAARLTAVVSPGLVAMAADQFAAASLYRRQSEQPNVAVDAGQPDTFLGGQPCIRHAFVHGGQMRDPVRSEFWWAGVVAGRGIQVSVTGTTTIIDLGQACRLRDLVMFGWPG